MIRTRCSRHYGLFLPVLLLSACGVVEVKDSAPPPGSVDISRVPDATPKVEPKSKCGNPSSYEVFGKRYNVLPGSKGFVERGIASWYGKKFHGRQTSNCEKYDMYAMTAAHKHLPLPTYVEVKNLKNGRKVVVRVNDRGPFHENRIIDLSYTAATKLDIVRNGTGLVEVRAIDPRTYKKGGAPVYSGTQKRGSTSFYIQVGAFSDYRNAERLRQKLGSLGQNIRISEAVVNGQRLYRVQIGPIISVDMADDIVRLLGSFGIWDHHITLK